MDNPARLAMCTLARSMFTSHLATEPPHYYGPECGDDAVPSYPPVQPFCFFLAPTYFIRRQSVLQEFFYSCVSPLNAIHPYLIGNIAADDSCGGGRSFAVTSTSSAFLDHDFLV